MNTQRNNKGRPAQGQAKGCHNCSQRRINCDRTTPRCMKCAKRGLTCPGYGLRVRFKDDLPAQTKKRLLLSKLNPPQKGSERLVSKADKLLRAAATAGELSTSSASSDIPAITASSVETTATRGIRPNPTELTHNALSVPPWAILSGGSYAAIREYEYASHVAPSTSANSFFPTFAPIYQVPSEDWEITGLFNHFSDHIAKTMITFDSRKNGYRSLLLPLAYSDTTLRDAVVAASAHHLALKQPAFGKRAERAKARAIQGVVERSRKLGLDSELDLVLMATLIVLMVDDMIVGSSDFAQLYRMLDSLLAFAGGEDCVKGTDIGDFLLRQINMLRLCTSPFMQENEAVSTQTERFQCSVEFINAEMPHSSPMDLSFVKATLVNCYFQASRLYSNRATSREGPQSDVIAELRQSLELLPPGSPGEHVLVWVYFMAAAESSSTSDRNFFLERLGECHTRTGFGNILRAYNLLSEIWAGNGDRWTSLLTRDPKVLIM